MNDRAREATLELGMTRMQAQLRAPEAVLRMRSPDARRPPRTPPGRLRARLLAARRRHGPRPHCDGRLWSRSSPRQSAASCRTNRAARRRSGITNECRARLQSRRSNLRRSWISRNYCDPRWFRDRASRHASYSKIFSLHLKLWKPFTAGACARLHNLQLCPRSRSRSVWARKDCSFRNSRAERLSAPLFPRKLRSLFRKQCSLSIPSICSNRLHSYLRDCCINPRMPESRSLATNALHLWLQLEDMDRGSSIFERDLQLPVPMLNPKLFLQLLHLDLKAHPPSAPIGKVRLTADPVRPRFAQGGLFLPVAPEAERLELTLARAKGVVGEERVGVAKVLDTNRPDPFRMERFEVTAAADKAPVAKQSGRIVKRIFRPPVSVIVLVSNGCPVRLQPHREVLACSGPWHSSGEWWSDQAWQHEEWDVAVREKEDVALYRIYRDMAKGRWSRLPATHRLISYDHVELTPVLPSVFSMALPGRKRWPPPAPRLICRPWR